MAETESDGVPQVSIDFEPIRKERWNEIKDEVPLVNEVIDPEKPLDEIEADVRETLEECGMGDLVIKDVSRKE